MGLLTRISGVFTTRSNPGRSRSSSASRHVLGVRDQASSLRAQVGDNGAMTITEPKPGDFTDLPLDADGSLEPVTRRVDVAPPPRNRQELFEDLQKNYREAVELIRKVDGHLDRDEARGQQFLSIARRLDDSLPTLDGVPQQIARIGEQIVEAVRAGTAADEKRLVRLEQSLDSIVSNLDRSATAQTELTTTMAAFRETLADIERANRRSSEALESMEEHRAAREEEMASMLATSRTWLLIALALCVGMGTVAMAISIVAMVTGA